MLQRFVREEDGHTAIEYALIAAMVSLGVLMGVMHVGENTRGLYEQVVAAMPFADQAPGKPAGSPGKPTSPGKPAPGGPPHK